jgi:hypothetical protein
VVNVKAALLFLAALHGHVTSGGKPTSGAGLYFRSLATEADPAEHPSHEAYEKAQVTFREAESLYRGRMGPVKE